MSHSHHHHNAHAHDHDHHHWNSNIGLAFFLNLFFTIIEFIGWWFTNSVAIMSDALHDLGDSFSLWLAWYLQRYSQKWRTEVFSYGYKRFSLLGALINALILWVGSVIILIEAVPRLFSPEPADAQMMFWLAILGIIVNGLAVFKTSGSRNFNEKIISLHLLEDVLGWFAVLVVSLVMMFSDIWILDPILSILITLFILRRVFSNLKGTLSLFLQATPSHINTDKISDLIKKTSGVVDIHDIHIWSLDGENNILTSHIVIKDHLSIAQIESLKKQIKEDLFHHMIQHATLEIEFENEKCEGSC